MANRSYKGHSVLQIIFMWFYGLFLLISIEMIALTLDIKPVPHLEQLHIRQGKGVSMPILKSLLAC